jgi:tetratricopeptide (TPR) repeat protein
MRAEGAAAGRGAFEAAVRLAPQHLQFALKAGEVLSRLGLHGKAEVVFKRAASTHPGSAEALIQTGNAQRRQGRAVEALDSYKASLAISGRTEGHDEDWAEAKYWIGSVLDVQGKRSAAIKAYESAIARQPVPRPHAPPSWPPCLRAPIARVWRHIQRIRALRCTHGR